MTDKTTFKELTERVALLEKESRQFKRLEAINTVLYRISDTLNTSSSVQGFYHTIHLALSDVIDTTNFYISLYGKSDDSLTFPYIVDTVDMSYPSALNVSRTASLTATVVQSQKPLLIRKPEILKSQSDSGLTIPTCTPAEVWLGVPLRTQRGIIGVMVVQSYSDPNCYDQTDIKVLVSVADMVAITLERKWAHEALQESEEKFRRIITTVREGIISMNAKREITFANSFLSEMFGYNLDELLNQPFEILLFEEDIQDFSKRQGERERGKVEQFERRFRAKDGREIWAIVSAAPMVDDEGKFLRAFATITDITERKKAEETLQEKNIELELAIKQINTLRGIIPICMNCKKVRDDKGYWKQVEVYVRDHTEAEFSHGVCPDCIVKLYPDFIGDT